MSRKNKETIIRSPTKSLDPPEAQHFDPETGEYQYIDKTSMLKDWMRKARSQELGNEDLTSVLIDPKQVAYAKKRRKK